MKHGAAVSAFEKEFAAYVGATHAIGMTNGTVTLEVALRACDVPPGDTVETTPLTMAATTIAILNVGAVPKYADVDPATWLMQPTGGAVWQLPVSLYGLHALPTPLTVVDDAAQTLRPHSGQAFTSYSLQRSKILNTGEGGVLVTNDDDLAQRARSIASLGYALPAGQSRIDSAAIKSPTYNRHHVYPCMNARMNDLTAAEGLNQIAVADTLKLERQHCATLYRDALYSYGVHRCEWLTPQHVPEGWQHDYWTFAVACDTPERALRLSDAIVKHGGERPYPAWKLSYSEPALKHLNPPYIHVFGGDEEGHHVGDFEARPQTYPCPVAESLQPRLLQFQTNDLRSAERNATALRLAIQEIDGATARMYSPLCIGQ